MASRGHSPVDATMPAGYHTAPNVTRRNSRSQPTYAPQRSRNAHAPSPNPNSARRGSGPGGRNDRGYSLWRLTRRRDGFGGEHPFNFWSRMIRPESPRIGYAPPESRTKRWAQESPIEGWFPLVGGEPCGCDVIRDAEGERIASHAGPGRAGSSLPLLRARSCLPSLNLGCEHRRAGSPGRPTPPARREIRAPPGSSYPSVSRPRVWT